MRKLIIATFVATSLLGAATAANAGFDIFGNWIPPICNHFWNGFAWVYVCY